MEKEQQMNQYIDYLCRELPNNWNLLMWESSIALNGKVFRSHSGAVVQRVQFRYGTNPDNMYESAAVHAFSLWMN